MAHWFGSPSANLSSFVCLRNVEKKEFPIGAKGPGHSFFFPGLLWKPPAKQLKYQKKNSLKREDSKKKRKRKKTRIFFFVVDTKRVSSKRFTKRKNSECLIIQQQVELVLMAFSFSSSSSPLSSSSFFPILFNCYYLHYYILQCTALTIHTHIYIYIVLLLAGAGWVTCYHSGETTDRVPFFLFSFKIAACFFFC